MNAEGLVNYDKGLGWGSFLIQVKLILSAEWTNSMIASRE